MKDNLEKTIEFYSANEMISFQNSSYFNEMNCLAKQLNYTVECQCGNIEKDLRDVYMGFTIVDKLGKHICAGDNLDYEHLSDSLCIIQFDKKKRVKFFSWEFDEDFIDSIVWTIEELSKMLKNQ